jgi:hypothetical protein
MTIPIHSKSRYIGLAVLADEIGCQVLIDQIPDLVQSLLNSLADPILTTHVSTTIYYIICKILLKAQSTKKKEKPTTVNWLCYFVERTA